MRRTLTCLAACVLLVCQGLPAVASEPDASDPPRVAGPLISTPYECEDDGQPSVGGLNGQSCSWSYSLLPLHLQADEDFSAYWIQMEVTPTKGWCAYELSFELAGLDGIEIVSASSDPGIVKYPKRTYETVELSVDARATAPVPGTIAQDVVVGPGRIKTVVREDRFLYRWTGKSRGKVVLAAGVQLAHDRLPSSFFQTWSEGMSWAAGTCRPIRIGGY